MKIPIAGLLFTVLLFGQTGPEVGATIPQFAAVDQSGVQRTSKSILGPKGALLVFFRSADW